MYSLHNFRNYAFSQNERVRYPLPLRPWVKGSEGIKELLVNPPLQPRVKGSEGTKDLIFNPPLPLREGGAKVQKATANRALYC